MYLIIIPLPLKALPLIFMRLRSNLLGLITTGHPLCTLPVPHHALHPKCTPGLTTARLPSSNFNS